MSVGYENGNQRGASQPAGQGTGQGSKNEPAPDLDALKDDVQEIAGAAVERGRQFMDSARMQATGYVDKRKGDVAQSVADLATSLREATSSFDDRPNIRAFADSAAQGLDQLADSIRERSMAEFYEDIEEVMRRRPAAVAAVTAAAGFILARFIRASADNLRDERNPMQGRRQAQGRRNHRPRPGDM